jgi:threonine dehydrogenase-like Zn-dependent dehydrogenase
MKALSYLTTEKRLKLIERPEPTLEREDEIKIRIVRVGICGTDRDEVASGDVHPPPGRDDLILGHEMFGRVVEAGRSVKRVKPGDYAVFTVRRGCGRCVPCSLNRSDMCTTGGYTERGIFKQDGFQAEYVVDAEQYVVRVPPELEPLGVLLEPLSVLEKAIDEALRIQLNRLPGAPGAYDWFYERKCLVAGLGPIGLLAATVLLLHGAEVYGLDIVDADSARPAWLEAGGGIYLDGRKTDIDRIAAEVGRMDVIIDATGISKLQFDLLQTLAINGIYAVTGIPRGEHPIEIDGPELMHRLVEKNQVMFGSVNASRCHFQMAVEDLRNAYNRWGSAMTELITHRSPVADFEQVFAQQEPDEIKVVIEWAEAPAGG